MSIKKRLISTGAGAVTCTTDSTDPFGDSSGVALYSLDYDASDAGGLYDGTPTNVEFGVGGQINYGARFNGSSAYISSSNILDTSSAFSYSLWVKPNTITTYDYLIGHQQSGSPYPGVGLLANASNTFALALAGGAPQIMTPSLTLGDWTHLVLTHDGSGNYTCYTNDNGSPITYSGATSNNSSNPFRLGFSSVSGWGYYDGDIDQVRIFSKALSSSEVSTLYVEEACVYTSTTDIVNYPTDTTPVAYYKMDNSSEDYSTGGNDGTDTNVEYRFGRFGQAAVFNGSSSYIDTNYTLPADSSYSISCWFNTSSTSQMCIYSDIDSNADSPTSRISLRLFSSGNFGVIIGNGSASWVNEATSSSSYLDGNWHHIVQVVNGTSVKLYVDGNTTPIADLTSTVSAGTAGERSIIFGRLGHYNGQYYNGDIDQVRIYSTALNSDQVSQLYNEKQDYITKDASDPFGDSSEVAFYEMENNANDSTGSYNGTAPNVTYSSDAIRGIYSASFNGSSSYIDTGGNLVDSLTAITVSGWFYTEPNTNYSYGLNFGTIGSDGDTISISRWNNTASGGFSAYTLYSNIGSGSVDGNFTLNENTWYHIAITWTGTTMKFYVNGNLETTATTSSLSIPASGNSGYIGRFITNQSYNWKGDIDQVRIFNTALEGDQVFKLYAEGVRETGL